MDNYKAQMKQDKILDEQVFHGKMNGFFVEVGALDGLAGSNSYFYEKEKNWTGLLIEPNPVEYKKILTNGRDKSIVENCAISNIEADVNFLSMTGPVRALSGIYEYYNEQHLQRVDREHNSFRDYPIGHELHSIKELIKIKAIRLETLFEKHNITEVDLLSIDVEGAELIVLQSINFDKVNIKCILMENNYGIDRETKLLSEKGYNYIGNIEWDAVFLKK